MKIVYELMDPTGNITIMVRSQVEEEQQPALALRLMELEKSAEQVGFLTEGEKGPALRMAGGEFCGNASMSAAVCLAMERGLTEGRLCLAVSGSREPVFVEVEKRSDGCYGGRVQMPLPERIETVRFTEGESHPVVFFPGIAHVILEGPFERAISEARAARWCEELGSQALGQMHFLAAEQRLWPLVYVPEAKTLCWENSCASGSSAVGAFLAAKTGKSAAVRLVQPGGVLGVEAGQGSLFLAGSVRRLNRKEISL